MSRDLPAQPNLDHLRKQAKRLLDELRLRDTEAKLADAQHQIARDYGFATWPKLKAHVESLVPSVPASPFDGLWKADLSKSHRHPANPFQQAAIHFDVDGDSVTITDVVVNEAGVEERHEHTIVVDGMEHGQTNGYVLKAEWRGQSQLLTSVRKDGLMVGWGRYEISADGQSLTITSDDQRIVMVRTGSRGEGLGGRGQE